MDKGNLGALREEDGEAENNYDVESDEESVDGGVRAQEPNKFDGLCDGVLNAMALVQTALLEYLEFKDEVLQHALPPNVLLRMGLVSGKVFRSVSDLHMPMNELIRLVRVYSTPWEEKSAALKKLHDDYEKKQRQLGIAVRRLQMIDTESKRVAKERRIMNWEKLFAKLTSAKGHGRRWKFMMKTFKDKAKEGFEHVKEYVDGISDEESEPGEDDHLLDGIETEKAKNVQILDIQRGSDTESLGSDDEARPGSSSSPGSRQGSAQKRVHFENGDAPGVVQYIKPETEDKSTWTHEPSYERFLNIKIHKPQGFDVKDIKCVLTHGETVFKTNNLDVRIDMDDLMKKMAKPPEKEAPAQKKSGRLIGTRGKSHAAMKAERDKEIQDREGERKRVEEEKKRLEQVGLCEDFELIVADELPKGAAESLFPPPDPLKIVVHHGPREEPVASATIEIEDLESCDLPVHYREHPTGDDPHPNIPSRDSTELTRKDSGMEEEEDIRSISSSISARSLINPDGMHLNFPLYSTRARGEAANTPVGQLPLTLRWGLRLRPRTFNRVAETMTVNELVQDLTGIDLRYTTKEELTKVTETEERAVSVINFTPEPPPEEMIPKSAFDEMVEKYDQQMQLIQEEYEARLQELADSIETMQQQANEVLKEEVNGRSASSGSSSRGRHTDSRSRHSEQQVQMESHHSRHTDSRHADMMDTVSRSPSAPFRPVYTHRIPRPPPPQSAQGKKNFLIGKPLPKWGDTLPQDFFERLKVFSEESELHRQEITEQRKQEVFMDNEKRLAGEFKLSRGHDEDMTELNDVSLPALFMPMRNSAGVFNPRAHQYFQPSGSHGVRLTQPPSILMLPPLSEKKISVVNLFDISNNFNRAGSDWLMDKFISDQPPPKDGAPTTPTPTMQRGRSGSAHRKSKDADSGDLNATTQAQTVEQG